MSVKSPYDWLGYVEKALFDLDQIPILGNVPSFSWKKLEKRLQELLQIDTLTVKASSANWYTPNAIWEELGSDAMNLNFSVLPLNGRVSFAISSADVNTFICWMVEKKSRRDILLASQFVTGLIDYVALEVLHEIQPFDCFEGFLLRLMQDSTKASTRVLAIDISLSAYKETIQGRLIIPESFRKNWIQNFEKMPANIPEEIKRNTEIDCAIEAARTTFTRSEWSKVKSGDFIPLANCHVDPDTQSGSLYLTIADKPFFRVRMKSEGLKILEQHVYEEENVSMDDDDFLSGEGDFPLESEDNDANELDQTTPGDPFIEDRALAADSKIENINEKVPVKAEKSSLVGINDIPMNVIVELSRFKITCDKLLQLKPGNLIELNVTLEKPVDLVVNGKKIAIGELIRVGETLGVRILERG